MLNDPRNVILRTFGQWAAAVACVSKVCRRVHLLLVVTTMHKMQTIAIDDFVASVSQPVCLSVSYA